MKNKYNNDAIIGGGNITASLTEKGELLRVMYPAPDFRNWIDEFLTSSNLKFDYTEFDGNAEGFRVLTKLQFLNDLHGLNLTSASLASFLKYPNTGKSKKSKNKDEDQLAQHKHGVFETEKDVLQKVMEACDITKIDDNSYHRHPISYIMEASVTICYLLMDLEDAISKGWFGYNDVRTLLMQSKKGDNIIHMSEGHFDADAPEKKRIVQLRSELMSYLVKLAFDNFKNHFKDICEGKYMEELVFDDKEQIAKIIYCNPSASVRLCTASPTAATSRSREINHLKRYLIRVKIAWTPSFQVIFLPSLSCLALYDIGISIKRTFFFNTFAVISGSKSKRLDSIVIP